MIPRTIHFIFFGFTEFTRIHYWAVKSAQTKNPGYRIKIHYSQAPQNNRYWNGLVPTVELCPVSPPEEFAGVQLDSYQYKADVLRLQILQDQGGIYLDLDVICLKSFDDLLDHDCVLGIESGGDDINSAESITNAVILAAPGHDFIQQWLEQTGENLRDRDWAYHAVNLPVKMLQENSYDVTLLSRNDFMPFGWRDESALSAADRDLIQDSYTMHLWETIWWDKLQNLDKNSLVWRECQQYGPNLRIAIYTICKNEAQHVERWANSNSEADLRLVCDTGSTDDTVKLLQEHSVTVIPISVMPWRFDLARNTSLNLLPSDIDICIWQDLDEELLPGWREQLEQHWDADTTTANHRYRNNNNPWQWHSKIHARHGCHWTGAVHETLHWNREEKTIWITELYLDEHQDVTKSRASYRDLLEVKIAEGDRNWRTYYFLANELAGQASIDRRIESYKACNEGDMVLSYIAKTIARGYAATGDHTQAQRWFNTATGHGAERETWFSLAEYWNQQKDWAQAYIAARRCLGITEKRTGFTQDPRAWDHNIYDIAALAAYNMGLYKESVRLGEEAVKMNPDDQRLKSNLEFYKEATR